MSNNTIIILSILGFSVILLIMIYNRIIALKQKCSQAFFDIDVQLKLRHDLIPNLVKTVKGYASHEKELLENVTKSRADAMNSKDLGQRVNSEAAFSNAITNLLAVAENYPALKANENFAKLQEELGDIENKVAAARRFFNNATAEFNTTIQQFPAVLVARIFGINSEVYFEVSAKEKEQISNPVQVKF